MVFLKKKVLQCKWVILGPKMTFRYNSGSALMVFFEVFYNKKDLEVHENYINGFSEKKSLAQ